MNFLTLRASNIYSKGGNCANYIRSNDQMTEACWQLPWLSVGDDIFFTLARLDFWPFAYNHKNQGGKPEDIFCPKDLADIMVHVGNFIKTVIHLSTKTCIMSAATLNYTKKYVGDNTIDDLFQRGKLFSLSMKECKPSCHPECFTNVKYGANPQSFQKAKGWNQMYTLIKAFHGNDTPCTTATDCLNVVEGSAEHLLMVEKQERNWAHHKDLYAKGEHNLQLYAKDELAKRDIKCDDTLKACGILQRDLHAKGEHNLQSYAKDELAKRGIECDDTLKAWGILQRDLWDKGEHNMQKYGNPMSNPETAAKSAKARSRKWTEVEEETLHEHIRNKKGIKKIAKEMKIGQQVVGKKCLELQLKIWNERTKCWQNPVVWRAH